MRAGTAAGGTRSSAGPWAGRGLGRRGGTIPLTSDTRPAIGAAAGEARRGRKAPRPEAAQLRQRVQSIG